MSSLNLTVVTGSATGSTKRSRLRAALAAAWGLAATSAQDMTALSAEAAEPRGRVELLIQVAFCRAHMARVRLRLEQKGPLVLPLVGLASARLGTMRSRLLTEAALARASSERYVGLAALAREYADLSTAWVCDLNRTEEASRARAMTALAETAVS